MANVVKVKCIAWAGWSFRAGKEYTAIHIHSNKYLAEDENKSKSEIYVDVIADGYHFILIEEPVEMIKVDFNKLRDSL